MAEGESTFIICETCGESQPNLSNYCSNCGKELFDESNTSTNNNKSTKKEKKSHDIEVPLINNDSAAPQSIEIITPPSKPQQQQQQQAPVVNTICSAKNCKNNALLKCVQCRKDICAFHAHRYRNGVIICVWCKHITGWRERERRERGEMRGIFGMPYFGHIVRIAVILILLIILLIIVGIVVACNL